MGKTSPPQIIVEDSPGLFARRGATLFTHIALDSVSRRGEFLVAISGGSSPRPVHRLLIKQPSIDAFPWGQTHFFWVDERCVMPDADMSNFGLAVHTFLLDVPIPDGNIHRVSGENTNYEAAAKDYEQVILKVFGLRQGQIPQFDLIILGMGADGHIASLMPNSNALFETQNLVRAVYQMDGDLSRITLTVPVIKQAAKIVVLISGRSKADIVHQVFQSEPDEVKYPVHFLWPIMDKIVWLMDHEAASLL